MSKSVYGFVRNESGQLVATRGPRNDEPTSRTELIDRLKAERARMGESLQRVNGTARALARDLRRSDSKPKLERILTVVPDPKPEE